MSLYRKFEYGEVQVSYENGDYEILYNTCKGRLLETEYADWTDFMNYMGSDGFELIKSEMEDASEIFYFKREILPRPTEKHYILR